MRGRSCYLKIRSALADAIAERLLDPALTAAEGDAGRAVAERGHDVRRRMDAVVAVYGNVLHHRKDRHGRSVTVSTLSVLP